MRLGSSAETSKLVVTTHKIYKLQGHNTWEFSGPRTLFFFCLCSWQWSSGRLPPNLLAPTLKGVQLIVCILIQQLDHVPDLCLPPLIPLQGFYPPSLILCQQHHPLWPRGNYTKGYLQICLAVNIVNIIGIIMSLYLSCQQEQP